MDPHNPEELAKQVSLALDYHQKGDVEKALSLYLELTQVVCIPMLNYNIGLIYFELEDYTKALIHFETAHELVPDDCDTLFNMGLCLKALGRINEAVSSYQQIVKDAPDQIDALYNLAGCYKDLRQYDDAIAYYLEALQHQPDHLSALNNLAYVYQVNGNIDDAIASYQQLLRCDPEREGAKFMLSALTGIVETGTPDSYVRELFDNYADSFESSLLENLNYSVPQKLRELVETSAPVPARFTLGLDLGCGTGLGGEAFQDKIDTLDGVDLSRRMVELADKKKIYRHLEADSITSFLQRAEDSYDIFLAVDVLAYCGDLHEIFRGVSNAAQTGACFAFSVEHSTQADYELRTSGRFAHSEEFIREALNNAHFEVLEMQHSRLRREGADWITGTLWVACKYEAL